MKYQLKKKQTTHSFAIRIVMLIVALLFLLLPAAAVGQEKNTSDASSHISKYILESSELESGVYKVHAKCIDADYNDVTAPLSELVTFKWGIKYQGQDISWVETDKSHIILHLQSQDEDVNVYFLRLLIKWETRRT